MVKCFSLDTYMSHEGVIYCKPHHKELFQPKAVVNSEPDAKNGNQDAVSKFKQWSVLQSQQRVSPFRAT